MTIATSKNIAASSESHSQTCESEKGLLFGEAGSQSAGGPGGEAPVHPSLPLFFLQSSPWKDLQAEKVDQANGQKLHQQAKRSLRIPEAAGALVRESDPLKEEMIAKVIENRRHDQKLVAQRHSKGFVWSGGAVDPGGLGKATGKRGSVFPAFIEKGFRSEKSPILKLFIAKLPAGSYSRESTGFQCGENKERISACARKVLGLDDRYVVFNGVMRGLIRIDIDHSFGDLAELKCCVDTASVPMPNIVVADRTTNKIARPHFYYILHDSICWTEDGRPKPQQLFKIVESILTQRLSSIGADPGGMRNSLRGKNPISPLMGYWITEEDPYRLGTMRGIDRLELPVLSQLLAEDQRRLSKSEVRAANEFRRISNGAGDFTKDQGAQGRPVSNSHFSTILHLVAPLVRQYHPASPDQCLQNGDHGREAESRLRHLCEDDILSQTGALAASIGRPHIEIEHAALKSLDHLWRTFDASKILASPPCNRGLLKEQCQGLALEVRQAIAGRHTASGKRELTMEKLVLGLNRLRSKGAINPTMARLCSEAAVPRSTAYDVGMPVIKAAADQFLTVSPATADSHPTDEH